MSWRANPDFMLNFEKRDSSGTDACCNCNSCIPLCPSFIESNGLPQRMTQYAQYGLKTEEKV